MSVTLFGYQVLQLCNDSLSSFIQIIARHESIKVCLISLSVEILQDKVPHCCLLLKLLEKLLQLLQLFVLVRALGIQLLDQLVKFRKFVFSSSQCVLNKPCRLSLLLSNSLAIAPTPPDWLAPWSIAGYRRALFVAVPIPD